MLLAVSVGQCAVVAQVWFIRLLDRVENCNIANQAIAM